jgi:hypothetical protein
VDLPAQDRYLEPEHEQFDVTVRIAINGRRFNGPLVKSNGVCALWTVGVVDYRYWGLRPSDGPTKTVTQRDGAPMVLECSAPDVHGGDRTSMRTG